MSAVYCSSHSSSSSFSSRYNDHNIKDTTIMMSRSEMERLICAQGQDLRVMENSNYPRGPAV
jgi:hypothetical protein